MSDETDAGDSPLLAIANTLGYLMGIGSLMLYTPIAIRLYRQKNADGTTVSTWVMKVISYTCNDLYYMDNHYPLSTYIDTATITVEASIVLLLVIIYQKMWNDPRVWISIICCCIVVVILYFSAPTNFLALSQFAAVALNSGALIPQFLLNMKQRSKGDYSPITTLLASIGCAVRLWTVQELTDNDAVLLGSFGIALVLNFSLLLQILYYGTQVEGLTLMQVMTADATSQPMVSQVEAHDDDEARFNVLISDGRHEHHSTNENDSETRVMMTDDIVPIYRQSPTRNLMANGTDASTDFEMTMRSRSR